MGVVGIAIKGFGKALKKPGKAFERAGDKWYKKTKKLQTSKKKSERIRGNLRVIAPMTVAAGVGAYSGAKSGMEEVRKRTHAAGQVAPARSLIKDIKAAGKKIKEKITKK
jgi:predicted small secreted protein